MQHCTGCGTPLSPEMTICPRCGKFVSRIPQPTGNSGDETLPNSFGAFQETMPPPYNPPPSRNYPPQAPYASSNSPAMVNYDLRTYSPSQQPALNPTHIPNTPPISSYPVQGPGQSRAALSQKTLISLFVLAGLIMLSGFSLIFYAAIARPAQLRTQATATVQAIQTINANGTATARNQATATAQAYAKATATSQAQAQATTTALQNIYNRATNGTPALASSLAFQTGSNWDIYDATGGGGCGFTGGALHASIAQKNFYVPCFAHATNFGNFALEVQMTILKGDEGGLIFRANDATSQFYIFRVGHDGTYTLLVSKDNTHNTPIAYDKSAAIKVGFGQTNLLTVIAQGSNFYLYINKQFIGSTNDGSYTTGEIGIFAGNNGNPTDVAFSNIHVWTL